MVDTMGIICDEETLNELFFVLFEIYVDYFNLEGKPDIHFITNCYIPDLGHDEVMQLSTYMRDFFNRLTKRDFITQILDFKMSYTSLSILARVE